jgi:hypothetical protein
VISRPGSMLLTLAVEGIPFLPLKSLSFCLFMRINPKFLLDPLHSLEELVDQAVKLFGLVD